MSIRRTRLLSFGILPRRNVRLFQFVVTFISYLLFSDASVRIALPEPMMMVVVMMVTMRLVPIIAIVPRVRADGARLQCGGAEQDNCSQRQ